ncbi:hypothetical protein H70357_24560 [Paenibacillus sp. FSL H7-0357]|uniref:hypothetical protein n=1 Tax=Paenibacillus sp. FSL H7-0357 TaxID=1536774 RepID=UPI0004F89578|nr:hypothetical protein [Paenibacillus sp. FSL H7-0357]AIQ19532.1 hypothetical protein H70357_24560 [Paenibacillus sp. FSL H7-0357]
MTDTNIIAIFGVIAISAIAYLSSVIISKQQATIHDMTNKLMAKDYREYKQMDRPPEPDPPKHKPMSWADDIQYNDELKQ